ncbi:hypothetical protein [Desulfosporosinus lacus]|uniref:hypothetical protein n=1 Tax=Desulfosporosinus lacus TaxID=329936 RepID=UPI0013564003|nr:hypothetical protein [Desulfosporosinus lacus]
MSSSKDSLKNMEINYSLPAMTAAAQIRQRADEFDLLPGSSPAGNSFSTRRKLNRLLLKRKRHITKCIGIEQKPV